MTTPFNDQRGKKNKICQILRLLFKEFISILANSNFFLHATLRKLCKTCTLAM